MSAVTTQTDARPQIERRWAEVPADFLPEVVELEDHEVDSTLWAFRQQCEGERLYEEGATLDDCVNPEQRRGWKNAENWASNAWRYAALASMDAYAVANGASPCDLDAMHQRLGI